MPIDDQEAERYLIEHTMVPDATGMRAKRTIERMSQPQFDEFIQALHKKCKHFGRGDEFPAIYGAMVQWRLGAGTFVRSKK